MDLNAADNPAARRRRPALTKCPGQARTRAILNSKFLSRIHKNTVTGDQETARK